MVLPHRFTVVPHENETDKGIVSGIGWSHGNMRQCSLLIRGVYNGIHAMLVVRRQREPVKDISEQLRRRAGPSEICCVVIWGDSQKVMPL